MSISDEAFQEAADELGVEVAAIKAVDEVESRGSGFLESGEPKILFEAHIFSRLTDNQFDRSHPNISSPHWNRNLYKGGQAEHDRLQKAVELDRKAALKSASWGRYQILGLNWDICRHENLQSFINAMYESEKAHLEAFVGFIKSENLNEFLRNENWNSFAAEYNGPGYKRNQYAQKMKEAFEKYQQFQA